MTPTEKILHNFLLISVGGVLTGSTACTEKETDGLYCFGVDEDAACPTVDEVNATRMPSEDECSSIVYLEATALESQSDEPYVDWYGPDYYDTGDDSESGDTCCYTATYRDNRDGETCAIGRPFVQDDQAVLADLHTSTQQSWKRNGNSIPIGTSSEREVAGRFYLQTARFEHASVASFNRFALDLMKFGAPAHLVHKAQMAAMDEIRHAQSAFAIANELLSASVQPGAMNIDAHLSETLLDFASAVLEEAAIQETLAVLLAAEQHRVAQDPTIKRYLEEVVREESQHAELAFETLRWCLQVGGAPILNLLQERLKQPMTLSLDNYPSVAIPELGLPARQQMEAVLERGVSRVIVPSLQSLVNSDSIAV